MAEITRDQILKAVYEAIQIVNETLTDGPKLELKENTALYGRGATIDSFALVVLIVEVEQRLSEKFGLIISLIDEKAMSQKVSPLRSVKSMIDYIYSNL